MRKVLIFIGILLIIIVISSSYKQKVEIKLHSCIDGDTAWFIINGVKQKVRFLGIDTPESVHPSGIVEKYGKEASDYTCNVLKKADNIYLEYDLNSDRYDKYDRVLGWVFIDNNNLSELLLSKGYAKVDYIYDDYKYLDKLCEVQENAYNKRIGIWIENDLEYKNNYCNK